MSRPSAIRLNFFVEDVSIRAALLWDEAPKTCAALVALLPLEGQTHQAIYSGSESVMLLAQLLKLPPENATSQVRRGDVGFAWLAAGSSYGVTEDFSEICWFYDHDAQPRMWEGPVEVNLFARIDEPVDAFYHVCRRIRREGVKPIRITSES